MHLMLPWFSRDAPSPPQHTNPWHNFGGTQHDSRNLSGGLLEGIADPYELGIAVAKMLTLRIAEGTARWCSRFSLESRSYTPKHLQALADVTAHQLTSGNGTLCRIIEASTEPNYGTPGPNMALGFGSLRPSKRG